jgi:hypothetical protein
LWSEKKNTGTESLNPKGRNHTSSRKTTGTKTGASAMGGTAVFALAAYSRVLAPDRLAFWRRTAPQLEVDCGAVWIVI